MKTKLTVLITLVLFISLASYMGKLAYSDQDEDNRTAQLGGDPQKGWSVFFTKNCVKCHSIWGDGGTIGPDLGRSSSTLSAGQLVGEMWNHIPRMRQKMEEENVEFTQLNIDEMADIFAFLYFIRYLGEPGNPEQGKTLLEAKGCGKCHPIQDEKGKIAPDLGKWGKYVNPVVWTQVMWNHASKMKEKIKEVGMSWPEFSSKEMLDLIAYIRNVSSSDEKVYLTPGNPAQGKQLFEKKNCIKCHSVVGKGGKIGPELASFKSPKNFIELTSSMWNHLPEMLKAMEELDVKVSPPTPQEMTDIISYLLMAQYMGTQGSAENGKKVFYEKNCIKCHSKDGVGGAVGPDLSYLKGNTTAVQMAYTRWRIMHGGRMFDEMVKLGIPWPYFKDSEMIDLIEYLNK